MFGKKTVDQIIATFNKTISDLRGHAEAMDAQAAEHDREAARHSDEASLCRNERMRAHAVASKLESIVSA